MDTYATIARIAASTAFRERLTACAAQQGAPDPAGWVFERRYTLAASPGWAAAVDYWQAVNPDADPDGWAPRPDVITDGAILAAVQPMVNPQPEPEAAAG